MAKRKPTDLVSTKVRLTEELRARLEQDAKKNNRSLNREIVHRIGMTYGEEGAALAEKFDDIEREVLEQMQAHMQKIISEKKKR